MKIDFKIDTEAFESTLVRYKVACEKAWERVLRQQTRLVAEKLMKFTPPNGTTSLWIKCGRREISKG